MRQMYFFSLAIATTPHNTRYTHLRMQPLHPYHKRRTFLYLPFFDLENCIAASIYLYDRVLFSRRTVQSDLCATFVQLCWTAVARKQPLVFILVCSFCHGVSLFTRDDDGNNNSGYGKLKTCQSFSNALLYRRVDREDRWEGRQCTCRTFKCFRIHLHLGQTCVKSTSFARE